MNIFCLCLLCKPTIKSHKYKLFMQNSQELIQVAEIFRHEFSFSQQQVNAFAEITGDSNPLHLDEQYAASTIFKRPIMHGFLGGSIFSKVFGVLFPGEGTVYLNQNMKFLRPMYVDTVYEAVFTVQEVNREKNTALVKTQMIDKATSKVTIEGEATVMNKNRI
jgi:acyl dehydratase